MSLSLCPLFLSFNSPPPPQGPNQEKQPGHLGSRHIYIYIPGSSRYVKFLPFGKFFRVKRHKFYTLGRSRYIIYIYIFYTTHCMIVPVDVSTANRPNRSLKKPRWSLQGDLVRPRYQHRPTCCPRRTPEPRKILHCSGGKILGGSSQDL